jgi:hypothetical protein
MSASRQWIAAEVRQAALFGHKETTSAVYSSNFVELSPPKIGNKGK